MLRGMWRAYPQRKLLPLPCPGAAPNRMHAAACAVRAHGGGLTTALTHSEVSELIAHPQQQATRTTRTHIATLFFSSFFMLL